MARFVMPTEVELLAKLVDERREMVARFDNEGWTVSSRTQREELDRLIAGYGGGEDEPPEG
jgi:hypothetical protein